jgi:hypothetical protein
MNGRLAIVLLLVFLFSDGVRINFLGVDPHRIVYAIRTKWLNAKIPHGDNEVFEDCRASAPETRSEAAPKGPTRTLEDALTCHVLCPLAGTMETVPIALHGDAPAFPSLNHKVYSISAAAHLWFDLVTPLYQFVEHVSFEIRLAAFAEHVGFAHISSERLSEMPDQAAI